MAQTFVLMRLNLNMTKGRTTSIKPLFPFRLATLAYKCKIEKGLPHQDNNNFIRLFRDQDCPYSLLKCHHYTMFPSVLLSLMKQESASLAKCSFGQAIKNISRFN